MHFVVVCGTNRAGAMSRLLAQEVAQAFAEHGTVDLLDMAELSSDALHPDAYRAPSPAVTGLVERFLRADGVVFIIPEYNGSYPGVLKLFVDMLPYPASFDGRPCGFIGLASGQFKSLRAVEHFQQVAGYRHAFVYPKRLFIGESHQRFVDGKLADDELTKRLRELVAGFVEFVARIRNLPKEGDLRG